MEWISIKSWLISIWVQLIFNYVLRRLYTQVSDGLWPNQIDREGDRETKARKTKLDLVLIYITDRHSSISISYQVNLKEKAPV